MLVGANGVWVDDDSGNANGFNKFNMHQTISIQMTYQTTLFIQ